MVGLGCFSVFVLLQPDIAFAQVDPGLDAVATAGGIATESDLPTIIGRIINIFLSFMGIVLLGLMVYAGFLWMTAGGEAEKVNQAKKTMMNAVIGLIIIVSAFAITNFIIRLLGGETGFGTGSGSGSNPFANNGGFPGSAGALGAGIIETHIPSRDATGVPRNASIVITFKEPIKLNSVIAGYNDNGTPDNLADDPDRATAIGLNSDVVKIYPSGKRDEALTTAQARVSFTNDRQTFVIRPVNYLGSATVNTDYTVEFVGGLNGLKLEDGTAAFGGTFSSGYKWQFQVSTLIDNTPPRITSVIPAKDRTYAPNVIVQMEFNEAIDPVSASGDIANGSGFTNITLVANGSIYANGHYVISNQYRTIEFVSDTKCGTNSCGNDVFCLPVDSSIQVTAKAATLSDQPPTAAIAGGLYDGLVDLAGNSLDGDGDGKSQGSDSDSVTGNDQYAWSFLTTSQPDVTAPRIISTTPSAGDLVNSSNLSVDAKIDAVFDKPMRSSTVNTDNVTLSNNEPLTMADTFWWRTGYTSLAANGSEATQDQPPTQGKISLDHRLFISATGTGAESIIPIYQPSLKSGLQNIYQNCYVPSASESCQADEVNPYCCDGVKQSTACSLPNRLP